MQDIIIEAIRGHKQLAFSYTTPKGTSFNYTINPYILGELGEGRNCSLHCFVLGPNSGWRDFHLSRIQGMTLLNSTFDPQDEGYNSANARYRNIIEQIPRDGPTPRR